MKFFDRNYDELYVGADVSVPTPSTEDLWNFNFSGTIISFDKENNYCIVEDGDGDCWAVEPERLELE